MEWRSELRKEFGLGFGFEISFVSRIEEEVFSRLVFLFYDVIFLRLKLERFVRFC